MKELLEWLKVMRQVSTEGLVSRESRESVNAFRCFFAEGEIGGTPCMRSHIFIHLATTISFAKPFIFKIEIEKEGLPRDSPAGLGAFEAQRSKLACRGSGFRCF